MPSGLMRCQQAESLHFLTFSCYHRLPYLVEDGAREIVEDVLEEVRCRHGVRVYAYVLMPEHVHLLVNEPPVIRLDQWIKVLKQESSRRLKGERVQFWPTRYFDRNVSGEDARAEVLHYIHQNPIKRGLISEPGGYRWGSYCHYHSGVAGTVEIESEVTASIRTSHSS